MSSPPPLAPSRQSRRWLLGGRVQGVGFRPFVYRLARHYDLSGWVRNLSGRVEIVAQGANGTLEQFSRALMGEAPPLARVEIISCEPLAQTQDCVSFHILPSLSGATESIHLPPDYFLCAECWSELHDPANRRYRYPFINCTQCGPRYTVIRALPYDRANTTLAGFELCAECSKEYGNPLDRRFHAEPVACPACGPQLFFHAPGRTSIDDTADALSACVAALREGKIVAVKGVGGYHLMCDARSDSAVLRLRSRKPRPHKPLAVMFPLQGEDGLNGVRGHALVGAVETRALLDPACPIVLVKKGSQAGLSPYIAPGLNEIGALLPYSPLHHLLLEEFGAPLVATSANISGEPVLTDNGKAQARLAHVADTFLHHNRPIARPADDAVVRVIAGKPRVLRLGRGLAPLELPLPFTLRRPLLACGAHIKNTTALAWNNRVVISPHIGDLGTVRSMEIYEQTAADLQALYGVRAEILICDAHPGYANTRWARRTGLPVIPVWHHHAHASVLAGEFPEVKNWLVFSWDGVGLGEDGTLWGGEALLGAPGNWRRAATLRPFHLPGGDKAARGLWRSALALCWEAGYAWRECPKDIALLQHAWQRRLNSPQTSAAGRLFDGAAALLGLAVETSFEGQGPMYLEAISGEIAQPVTLPLQRNARGIWQTEWAPLIPYLLNEDLTIGQRGAGFHASLAQTLLQQARVLRDEHGVTHVGLSGGVFQNCVLTEQAMALLNNDGFEVRLTERVPCNDGGISYGQIIEARARLNN